MKLMINNCIHIIFVTAAAAGDDNGDNERAHLVTDGNAFAAQRIW